MKTGFTGMIIDDDDTVRKVLSYRLAGRECYEIFEASDGVEGLRLAKEKQPDFILLDWMMPEMDGYEVLVKLKSESLTSDIPVFMLTSKGKMENVEMALAIGAEGYFSKPVKVDDIAQKIRPIFLNKSDEIP
jgi:CheY-like chemotaxis protein